MLCHRASNIFYRPFTRSLKINSPSVCFQKQDVIQSEPASKTDVSVDETGHFQQIKTITPKLPKLPARQPLVKNFFTGRADTELLIFPEVISRDAMANVEKDCEITREYFQHINDQMDGEIFHGLKKLKSFGVNVAEEHGGRGYNYTECNLNTEVEAEKIGIAMAMNVHQLVAQIVADFGSDEQQKTFLPRLASGELIGTVAFFENEIPKKGLLNTTAKLSSMENHYQLKGVKSSVVNATNANLFLVFGQSVTVDHIGDPQNGITVFLVDATTPRVHVQQSENTIGFKSLSNHSIIFDNCDVPIENIIGNIHKGNVVAQKMLENVRLQSGLLSTILAKRIIKNLTEFCINTSQLNMRLMDMELLRKKLAEAVCSTYALESMLYFTTGLIDVYDKQDTELETAIIKTFGQETLLKITKIAYAFMGPKVLLSDDPINQFMGDALHLYSNAETKDSLDLFIGFTGLQHAGLTLNEEIKKIRNPLMNPSYIIKKILTERGSLENIKLSMNLNHHVHMSLDLPAKWLEQSIIRLKMASEVCLSRHGADVLQKQIDVCRLSQCATLIYAMYASLARASRSYCIGLTHCDYDMLTASTFSFDATQQIMHLVKEVNDGLFHNSDAHHNRIAEQLFKSKGYFLEHPLTRNF